MILRHPTTGQRPLISIQVKTGPLLIGYVQFTKLHEVVCSNLFSLNKSTHFLKYTHKNIQIRYTEGPTLKDDKNVTMYSRIFRAYVCGPKAKSYGCNIHSLVTAIRLTYRDGRVLSIDG